MFRDISKDECPNARDIGAWLANETGGAVVMSAPPIDKQTYWRVPVFSADGGHEPNRAGAGRMMFSVIRPHIATDGTKYKGELIEYSFTSDIEPGSTFSAAVPTDPHIDDETIFIESGPQHQGERKQFDSVSEPKGWTPRTGNSSYAPGAHSDTGRFSHPQDPVKR
jgi:hypothetical protein